MHFKNINQFYSNDCKENPVCFDKILSEIYMYYKQTLHQKYFQTWGVKFLRGCNFSSF